MDRRKALQNMGWGLGAVAATPALSTLFQSCQTAPSWTPKFFAASQWNMINELMELIIPETDIPGAKSLKLAAFSDAYIDAVLDEERQKQIQSSIDAFEAQTLKDSGKSSLDAVSVEDLDAQLAKYLKGETPEGEEVAAGFANELRSFAVRAFKTNEFIGEQVMAYAPIPGEQRGCVDLMEATGGKAWSL
jgi:hypothetical protein